MRHGKICFVIIICCLLPLTTYAENKQIIIPCAELSSIEIKQPPSGYPFSHECGDKCFYIEFIMNDTTAQKFNEIFNDYKQFTRELYLDKHLLFAMEPFYLDIPYAQKVGSVKVHMTLEDAIDEAYRACPDVTINVPYIIRH